MSSFKKSEARVGEEMMQLRDCVRLVERRIVESADLLEEKLAENSKLQSEHEARLDQFVVLQGRVECVEKLLEYDIQRTLLLAEVHDASNPNSVGRCASGYSEQSWVPKDACIESRPVSHERLASIQRVVGDASGTRCTHATVREPGWQRQRSAPIELSPGLNEQQASDAVTIEVHKRDASPSSLRQGSNPNWWLAGVPQSALAPVSATFPAQNLQHIPTRQFSTPALAINTPLASSTPVRQVSTPVMEPHANPAQRCSRVRISSPSPVRISTVVHCGAVPATSARPLSPAVARPS